MPAKRICNGCDRICDARRCSVCRRAYNQARHQRAKHRSIWSTTAWKQARLVVLSRDGYRCQECGAPATVAHHLDYDAPFDPDTCIAVCARCSGSSTRRKPAGHGTRADE